MKLQHDQSLSAPLNLSDLKGPNESVQLARIQCLSISPNLTKLAACFSHSNHVVLYDLTNGEERDKFALKSATAKSASRKTFVVKGLCFSADSEKIAIGQTDCVIYVYRIGEGWGNKKSIVNKFTMQSPVAALHWLPTGIIFSSIDGRVKFIQTQTNKMFNVISHSSICVSLCYSHDQIVAGFYSGHIVANSVAAPRESSARQLATHSCPPYALALTSTGYVCAAGSDGRILFQEVIPGSFGGLGSAYDKSMSAMSSASSRKSTTSSSSSSSNFAKQTIEWGYDISHAATSPSGTVVVFASKDNLVMFELESRVWRQKMTINLNGGLLVSGLCWSGDGTKLVASTLNGAIELFKCRWRSKLFGNRFEINYVGNRQIVIKDLESKTSSIFNSNFDVQEVKVIKERFTVIWTSQTLLMGSLGDPKQKSEIEWSGLTTHGVKFSFDYENVVLISAIGELFLVELGQDRILGSVRTDFVSPHLLSVRINERKSNTKVFAYLLDAKTIAVVDLITGLQLCTWSHNERIDWIELNELGNKLIYRDKALKLILLNLITQEFLVLLTFCGFVQWVPGSDVIVAQSKDKLYIWYDFTKPVIHQVAGGELNDAIEIERKDGSTRVLFAMPNSDIDLDEVLLEFDTAIDDGDLERAEAFLESLSESNSANADLNSMWLLLGEIALKRLNLSVGERAFAALGDIAKVAFIRQCQQDQTMIALLDHDWERFESGDFDTVLQTYLRTYNWDRAIQFARRQARHDLVEDIQAQHYKWLLDTGQNSSAAQILEKSGKIEEAIAMYLKSGRMLQVTKLIVNHFESNPSSGDLSKEQVQRVITELERAESFEEAGDLYQLPVVDNKQAALKSFVKGKAFSKAITLARVHFPDEVVSLENQYAEYLLNEQNDAANAVNHFIEAGKSERALEAAVQARQFDRASEIASILDHIPAYYGKKIGDHYATKEDIESAVEMYLNAGCIRDAVTLLNNKGQYARAYKVAKKLMEPSEAKEMYDYIAKSYESDGKWREAEKIYLACGDTDSAISMYKNAKQYEQMVRLVRQYHPGLLNETCLYLAKELESDRQYKQAETYFISAGEWKTAALMYKNASLWEDAYRVSRAHGGATAAKQVAFHWAQTMPSPTEAVALLNRYGLLNQVVDYAIENNEYDFALSLISNAGNDLKHKLIDVRLKYALHLENEGHFNEAELMFIEANKPKEAVVMYLHANNFDDALRVAEGSVQDEEVVKDVLTAQARFLFERERNNVATLTKVESLLLRAGRIEVAIRLYKDVALWNEAVRVAEQYAPHLLDALRREMITEAQEGGDMAMAYYGRERRASRESTNSGLSRTNQTASTPPMDQADLFQALKTAEQNDDKESIVRYTVLLASQLLKDRQALDSLKILAKHESVFMLPDSKKLLSRIAVIILSELDDFTWSGQEDDQATIYAILRDCFLHLLNINSSLNSIERELFDKYLLISHYLTLKTILQNLAEKQQEKNANVRELHLKLSVSLLRYTDMIRADKAFYEAGVAARAAGRLEMAFVFLNHFLDLLDAIEEQDLNVDHSDFVGTDIPYEVPLPTKIGYETTEVEAIKSWILQTSMDTEVSQSLPLDPMRDGEVYEASLINSNNSRCLPCLATGYPVIRHKMIEFVPSKYVANKEDWNKLLMVTKVIDDRHLKDVLQFIGRLCGNTAIVKFSFQ